MAWSFEFRFGLLWAVVILVLMSIAIWAASAAKNLAPLIIPIAGYVAFAVWVFRIKK